MRARVVVGLVVVVFALNLAAIAAGSLSPPSPEGPPSSSYSTTDAGVGAYADLLEDRGYDVRRQRGSLADAVLRPGETLVLLDPEDLPPDEVDAVRRFVVDGGRLVAGAHGPAWLPGLLGDAPTWVDRPADGEDRPFVPVPEVRGVERVTAPGAGSWDDPGRALPVLGTPSRTLLVVTTLGRGRIALLADTSALRNAWLDQADNAALGVALAGETGGTVVFAEGVHGFGAARGLAAIPVRWRWALVLAGAAGLVWVASRVRRVGPPERGSRALPPPRREFVDAVAAALGRSDDRGEAVEPVRDAVRERIAVRAGLGRGASPDELRRAGERAGLSPGEVGAVLGSSADHESLLGAGRALAHMESRRPTGDEEGRPT